MAASRGAPTSPDEVLLRVLADGLLVGEHPPLDADTVRWPAPPGAPRALPAGWSAARVEKLRVGLPPGWIERDETGGHGGSVTAWGHDGPRGSRSPVLLAVSVARAFLPFVAQANQLAARVTADLGVDASEPVHPVEVPRSPCAVIGTWRRDEDGVPVRSTVALVDGEDGERYTVQLDGTVDHLPEALVELLCATLSIGLLNTAW